MLEIKDAVSGFLLVSLRGLGLKSMVLSGARSKVSEVDLIVPELKLLKHRILWDQGLFQCLCQSIDRAVSARHF